MNIRPIMRSPGPRPHLLPAPRLGEPELHRDRFSYPFVIEAFAHRDHQPAARDLEVERLIQSVAAVLGQHVAARNAKVRRAVLNIGRHIGRAQDDEPHTGARSRDDQFARSIGVFGRDDARRPEQRQGFVKEAPFRQGDADHGYLRHETKNNFTAKNAMDAKENK
mgnify:CR=1 FL=1